MEDEEIKGGTARANRNPLVDVRFEARRADLDNMEVVDGGGEVGANGEEGDPAHGGQRKKKAEKKIEEMGGGHDGGHHRVAERPVGRGQAEVAKAEEKEEGVEEVVGFDVGQLQPLPHEVRDAPDDDGWG